MGYFHGTLFHFYFHYNSQERLFDTVTIALVGKYTDLKDSYMSVIKALEHSAFRVHRKLIIHVCHFPKFPFTFLDLAKY